jgi:hypothetical protein
VENYLARPKSSRKHLACTPITYSHATVRLNGLETKSCAAMKSCWRVPLLNLTFRRPQNRRIHAFKSSKSSTSTPSLPSIIGCRFVVSMASTSRIVALAKEIETQTAKLSKFFADNGLPPPSFDEDAPLTYSFPPEVAEAQEALSAAVDELWWLNQGPIQTIVAKAVCHECHCLYLPGQCVNLNSLPHPWA